MKYHSIAIYSSLDDCVNAGLQWQKLVSVTTRDAILSHSKFNILLLAQTSSEKKNPLLQVSSIVLTTTHASVTSLSTLVWSTVPFVRTSTKGMHDKGLLPSMES